MSSSPSKSTSSCSSEDDNGLRRGPWTADEDTLLINYIATNGEGHWNLLAKQAGLKRTGKSCRLRWLNYLKPDVKRGNLTPEEQLLILELHSKWGNRWSKIAQHLPGRTDNEIKNYWRTRVQKQARHLKIDTNSKEFQEIVRCFWIPRLLQKVEGSLLQGSCSSSQVLLQDESNPLPPDRAFGCSETATPTQIPFQGQYTDETVSLNHHQEQNSDMGMMQLLKGNDQFWGVSPSEVHSMDNSCYNNCLNDCYYSNNNVCYGFEALNMASSGLGAENFQYPVGDCRMAESNWVRNEFAGSIWNLDELL